MQGGRLIIDLYLSRIVLNGLSQASCFSKERVAPVGAVTEPLQHLVMAGEMFP